MAANTCGNPYCAVCAGNSLFEFPNEIVENIHDVVLFVGAGVSTENHRVWPTTFYEEICDEIGVSKQKNLPFSEVMSRYVAKTGSKRDLVNKIKERLDNIKCWPDLCYAATDFHRELSSIPCIENIVTTNWDDFFERVTNAQPFVTSKDMIFSGSKYKKVFKIHGSINNLDSIVATKEDYRKCYSSSQKNLIGGVLKSFLANKLMVFIGYSAADEDFRKIYRYIKKEMGEYRRRAWIVTPDKSKDKYWKQMGFVPVYTGGTHFLSMLRKAIEPRCLLPLKNLYKVETLRRKISTIHVKTTTMLSLKKYPEVVYCLFYQDGIIHAFDILKEKIFYGDSLCEQNILNRIKTYEKLQKQYRRRYSESGYIQGFLHGMKLFFLEMLDDPEKPRLPLVPYYSEVTRDIYTSMVDFKRTLGKNKSHPAVKIARTQCQKGHWDDGIIPDHRPRL